MTEPKFAFGQWASLVQSEAGNILWDCVSLVEEATVARLQALGGVKVMAIPHPHYCSSMVA